MFRSYSKIPQRKQKKNGDSYRLTSFVVCGLYQGLSPIRLRKEGQMGMKHVCPKVQRREKWRVKCSEVK